MVELANPGPAFLGSNLTAPANGQTMARATGVLFLVTYAGSIPAFLVLCPGADRSGLCFGAGV